MEMLHLRGRHIGPVASSDALQQEGLGSTPRSPDKEQAGEDGCSTLGLINN